MTMQVFGFLRAIGYKNRRTFLVFRIQYGVELPASMIQETGRSMQGMCSESAAPRIHIGISERFFGDFTREALQILAIFLHNWPAGVDSKGGIRRIRHRHTRDSRRAALESEKRRVAWG